QAEDGCPELTFSADGKVLAVAHRGVVPARIELWDLARDKIRRAVKGPDLDVINQIALGPDGKHLAGIGRNEDADSDDPSTSQLAGRVPAQATGGMVRGSRRHPLLKWSGVFLWDLKGAKRPRRLPGAGASARMAFGPDGKTLAYHSNGFGSEIYLWDVTSARR